MTPFLYGICGAATLLVFLLVWALRRSSGTRRRGGFLEEQSRSNIQYSLQIQQSLGSADYEFLLAKGGAELAGSVVRERRKIALDFLSALNDEFSRLLRLARIIASLSPEVAPMQEFERVRLSVVFHLRLRSIRVRLAFGTAPALQLGAVSDLVSRLSVRMETAMKELGERAALAVEMASATEGNDARLA
jgi:hypothetical protein